MCARTRYIKSQGWTAIRLGVIWAGAQPTAAAELDAEWLRRLQAILALCDRHSIRVMLDVHQDAVGTANCGEGVPMWYSKLHFPRLIGKPILGPSSKPTGDCSTADKKSWALHAGDPLYNVLNPCCLRWNTPGPWGNNIDATDFSLLQIEQLTGTDAGRKAYATYIRLLAEAVAQFPAAISIELMNEPPTVDLGSLYRMYQACYDAVRPAAPDLALGFADTGSEALGSDAGLPTATRTWLHSSATHVFYAWHCYGCKAAAAAAAATKRARGWHGVAFLTEFGAGGARDGGAIGEAAAAQGVGWTQYQYNGYCNVPCRQGQNTCPRSNSTCSPGMPCAFGACIT